MRDYAKIAPSFWTGRTGKKLRGNHEAQIVALYLLTTQHANMIGVFNCPIAYISHDTGLPLEGALKGLQSLIEADFCTFDSDTDVVWVHEMARFQVDESLSAKDNRVKGILKEYERIPSLYIRERFYEKYCAPFLLPHEEFISPLQAPCETLLSQEQEQEQEYIGNAIAFPVVNDVDSGERKSEIPKCPHSEILDLFSEILPEFPQPRVWDGERPKSLRARWRWVLTAKKRNGERYATTAKEAMGFFRRYFEYVRKCPFLMGETGWHGCDLPWLIKADNFDKVLSGKYERKEAA